MTLREWIESQKLTQREAAARLGVHEITLNKWVNGRMIPRRAQMETVEARTGGAVCGRDFFAPATPQAAA
jgi:transcriptional regulator with XRE-family HTH domain